MLRRLFNLMTFFTQNLIESLSAIKQVLCIVGPHSICQCQITTLMNSILLVCFQDVYIIKKHANVNSCMFG